MKLVLNDDELSRLFGLRHDVICLYLCIRVRMDYATAMVGVKPRISWHALTEWLYVEPKRGPGAHGSPSVQQVRRMARHLIDAGLIRMHSLMNEAQLIFECVKARRDSFVQKKPDRNPTAQPDREPDRGAQSENTPKPDREPDRGEKAKPDRHPLLSSTSTTTPCGVLSTAPVGADWTRGLIYSPRLTPAEKRFCSKAVSPLPVDHAQELLDELAGALDTADVRSRTAYFRAIVRRYHEGSFTPEKACTVREARDDATKRAAYLASLDVQRPPDPTGERARLARGEIKRRIGERTTAR